ncbi:hypothetical protein AhyVDH1_042 [Aeromonas phage AhyVDH1]|nr:hypothetical protein AhyVDH1_042 [Aeromonas phage AhyVDH1]
MNTLTLGQEVTLISGQLATVQQLMADGQVKVRFICDTCSLTVSRDKVRPVVAKHDGSTGCAKALLNVMVNHGCGFGYNDRAASMSLDHMTGAANSMRSEMLHILAEYRHDTAPEIAAMRSAVVGLTGFVGVMVGLKCISDLKAVLVRGLA